MQVDHVKMQLELMVAVIQLSVTLSNLNNTNIGQRCSLLCVYSVFASIV